VDPLIDTSPAADSDRAMAAYRAAIGEAVRASPTADDHYVTLSGQLAR
jgi:tryptophan halogenase